MTTTTTKPDLYWNERGQTGCALPGHAPYRGSDTWRFEHWKKVPANLIGRTQTVCTLCGWEFDRTQMGDPAMLKTCPSCHEAFRPFESTVACEVCTHDARREP